MHLIDVIVLGLEMLTTNGHFKDVLKQGPSC